MGWRWIGANHLIYYNILFVIVNLFELGFWRPEELIELVSRLYNVSEILIVLERNTQLDSAKLAQNFIKELIKGFGHARESIMVIIIHI